MTSSEKGAETIQLTLPLNASYVSAARLTASSIANRMKFDIDEIEDVKAAVSEACTFIIKKITGSYFTIFFNIQSNILTINLCVCASAMPETDDDEMSLLMIKALMDELNIERINGNVNINMLKTHKETSL